MELFPFRSRYFFPSKIEKFRQPFSFAVKINMQNRRTMAPFQILLKKTFRTLFQQFGILSEDPDALIATFLKNAEKRRTCKDKHIRLDTDYDTGTGQ